MSNDARVDAPYKQWQVPPQASPDERKLKWLNEATEEGQAWLKSQRGIYDWKRSLDVISGRMDQPVPEYRSHVNTNHLKRNIREIVGTLAKIRPIWGYSSDNGDLAPYANYMNLLVKSIYLEQFFDVSIREVLQYSAATCTGFARPIFRRDMAGTGTGEIRILSYGAPCILPVQLPASGDYQQAYIVTILDEMPIYMAHGMFPEFQEQLNPTSSLYWYSNEIRTAARGNLWNRMWGRGQSKPTNPQSDLYIPVRYTYVIDLSVNKTGKMIPMGEIGSSWYYEVPNLGSEIPTGIDPKTGQKTYRKADANDARLYPRRRLMISSESCVMYDGPSFDWHGRVPAIPFTLDRWPWEPIGLAMVRDGYDIQYTINELWRGVADKLRAQNDPGLAYDIDSVSSKEAKQFDPMQPRARVGFSGSQVQEPFQMPIPPEVLKVSAEMFTAIDALKETMDEQHAIKDMMALAKARMASDDIEKLLEACGPIIEDMSRGMEPPMRELANQIKYLVLQHIPPARAYQYLGDDNMTRMTFDYDPASLVPSHLPGEDINQPSPTDKITRARTLAENLRFTITPRSLHEMTQMVMKLGLIQLKKAGVKIDSQTLADAWQVPNYGQIKGATVMEKFWNEAEQDLQHTARLAMLSQGLAGPSSSPGPGTSPGGGPPVGPLPSAPPAQEGRPPSGHAAPALKMKPDGRSTITESEGGGRTV